MTTEDQALHAAGLLIGSIPGFNEDAMLAFVDQFQKHAPDADALIETCERLATTWSGRMRPSLGEVLDEYRKYPTVAAEREASTAAALARTAGATHCQGSGWVDVPDGNGLHKPCPRCNPYLADVYADADKWGQYLNATALSDLHADVTRGKDGAMHVESMPGPCKVDTIYDPEKTVDFAVGMQIARDEYRSVYGREIGDSVVANPVYAADIIQRVGNFDPNLEAWHATYTDVAVGFNNDHPRAIASLHALGRRLTHDSRGRLMLRPPEEPVVPPQPRTESSAPTQPPPPSERATDASAVLSEALGETRRRMEEQHDEGAPE